MTIGNSVASLLDRIDGILSELGVDRNITIGNRLLGSTLSRTLVGSEVEANEKDKVARKNTTTGEGSELLASTPAVIRHPCEISRGEVSVRSEVNESKIDNELGDLKTSNPLLPPDLNTAGRLEVVPVHDNVNSEVQGDGNPRHRSVSNQLGVAKQGSGTMMVAVKESERLLFQEQENGVKELDVFGEVVEIVKDEERLSPSTIMIANTIEQSMIPESRNQLFQEENKKSS